MTEDVDRIITNSRTLYDRYGEEYRGFNRLIIGLSAGAVTIVSTVLGNNPGSVTWLMTTGLVLYLLSLSVGLSIEYAFLTQLRKKSQKLADLAPSYESSVATHEEYQQYLELPYTYFKWLSSDFPLWKLHFQIASFLFAVLLVFLDFLLFPNAPSLWDLARLVFAIIGTVIITILIGFLFSKSKSFYH